MTMYYRYVLDNGGTVTTAQLETGLREIDGAYRIDGDGIMRGDHDCAILIDVSYRGDNCFDDDVDLLAGFAEKRADTTIIMGRLKASLRMVTAQVVSQSDERALEHVWRFLRNNHPGLLVYEGGGFDIPNPRRRCPSTPSFDQHKNLRMESPTQKPRSRAAKASWAALVLALGCAGIFLIFQVLDQIVLFERTRQGVLMGSLPRTSLCVLWAGEALATVVGIGSFLLIRPEDITSKAIFGIVARSLGAIAAGLFGVIFLCLVVGHVVVGF